MTKRGLRMQPFSIGLRYIKVFSNIEYLLTY